jgi:hypothetical protein
MKLIIALFCSLMFALPAYAGNVESRAAAVKQQTEGNNSYYAYLAREYANIAEAEKAEHDVDAARRFIKMAEENAAQAGGVK